MNSAGNEKKPDKLTDNEIIKALNGADGLGHISIYCADNNGKDVCSIKFVDIVDLINRQNAALEKSLNALCKKEDIIQLIVMERQQYYDELQKAKDIIRELRYLYEQAKAEATEVKHGEWIKHKPDPEAMRRWHALGIAKGMSENSIFWTCSCCKEWGTPAHKYCSQCGAKMDGATDTKVGTKKEGAAGV